MQNRVVLIGRVGIDPVTRQTLTGKSVTNVTLVTSDYFKLKDGTIKEDTQWHNLTIWNAELIGTGGLLKKGVMLAVVGSIRYRSWEDENGIKRYRTEVDVRSLRVTDDY